MSSEEEDFNDEGPMEDLEGEPIYEDLPDLDY